MNLLNLLPTALALLSFTCLTAAQAPGPAQNRTFIMTAYNTTNLSINGKPILISPSKGIGSVVINVPPTTDAVPLQAFIYNRNIYRYCTTSRTGVCIGMLSKAYAGALTGWYFDFSDDETPKQVGPVPGIVGGFGLLDDVEYPTPTSKWPCKPHKPKKVKVLGQGVSEDGKSGIDTWAACDLGPQGSGPTNGYMFNSIPVPTFAHNGPQCGYNYGVKFKIAYTN